MTYRKKLIEVALPLEAINRESAREKSIRHGHPSTLHLWWARRPLAACRAVLFSSLVDDPSSDPHLRRPDGSQDEDAEGDRRGHLFNLIEELVKWENSNVDQIINAARAEIARSVASRKIELGELKKDQPLTGGITPWDLIVRGPVRTRAQWKDGKSYISIDRTNLPADAVNAFLAEHAPPVLDPFCGGGSIPLEAQRLGLRAFASDLNPVPVLITKALIEIPPKFAGRPPVNPEWQKKSANEKAAKVWRGAEGLAEDVRYYGKWMRDEAEKRIGHLYPKVKITAEMAKDRPDLERYVGEELTVIAWLWARTVPSPNPAMGGAHVPLVRSFWLSMMKGNEAWVEPLVDRAQSSFHFEVRTRASAPNETPRDGIMARKGGNCLISGVPMPYAHIRTQARAGQMGSRLMAIVAEGDQGRVYLSPEETQVETARLANPAWRPEGEMPKKHRNFQPPVYGMENFGDLFTKRQLVALTTFCDLVQDAQRHLLTDAREVDINDDERSITDGGNGAVAYADAACTYLGLFVSSLSDRLSTLCSWDCGGATWGTKTRSTFSRQALPMTWDFAEVNPFSGQSGSWENSLDYGSKALKGVYPGDSIAGCVKQLDALTSARQSAAYVTDPPYYDNIGYADLSDYFYLWLRRSLGKIYPSLFATLLTPKSEELIAAPHRHGGDKERAGTTFEEGLYNAFTRMRATQDLTVPLTLFYAFKQAEEEENEQAQSDGTAGLSSTGWETMLAGLINAGFSIHGTWPVRTELRNRTVGRGANALASSIVLVCRPRAADAPMTTRKDFVAALKKELPSALRDLQSGNIAPVDLAQAAIGPGMAIYSRYSKVVNSDGTRMPVRNALQLINQALDEVLSELESEFDSETRWAIKWFEQHAHDDGAYGTAETLSTAMAVSVNGLKEAGLIKSGQGKVRLLRRAEMGNAADRGKGYNPATDKRLTIWEVTQYLIRRLESGGDEAAAELLRKVGTLGEVARDLAYRLYSTCERKKWAEEARSYNGLVVAWPEIVRLSREAPARTVKAQAEMFE